MTREGLLLIGWSGKTSLRRRSSELRPDWQEGASPTDTGGKSILGRGIIDAGALKLKWATCVQGAQTGHCGWHAMVGLDFSYVITVYIYIKEIKKQIQYLRYKSYILRHQKHSTAGSRRGGRNVDSGNFVNHYAPAYSLHPQDSKYNNKMELPWCFLS